MKKVPKITFEGEKPKRIRFLIAVFTPINAPPSCNILTDRQCYSVIF